jgi:hypothetical protein
MYTVLYVYSILSRGCSSSKGKGFSSFIKIKMDELSKDDNIGHLGIFILHTINERQKRRMHEGLQIHQSSLEYVNHSQMSPVETAFLGGGDADAKEPYRVLFARRNHEPHS